MTHGYYFADDLERLRDLKKRVNRYPLGCGVLAGNPLAVDRKFLAKSLGFEGVLGNSLVGVANRDFDAETMMWGSLLMSNVSRWAGDLSFTTSRSLDS
jgi:argininosuccinate lyase